MDKNMLHYVFMYKYTYPPTIKCLKAMNLEESKGSEIHANIGRRESRGK